MKLNARMIIKHNAKKIFNNYAILPFIFLQQIFQITKILFVWPSTAPLDLVKVV